MNHFISTPPKLCVTITTLFLLYLTNLSIFTFKRVNNKLLVLVSNNNVKSQGIPIRFFFGMYQ
jgi:hypothetical protein